ncbi:MAG: phosphatase [Bacteroidia bacterium]
MHDTVADLFSSLGGTFVTSSNQISEKLKDIKALVFDWDGVFNNAAKNENKSSTFNEADSMGTNLIRFSHYLLNQELPVTAIISGEKNEMATYFCEREHFTASYFKISNKVVALNHLCSNYNITPSQVCYFFDDVLDLSIAEVCGIRMLVKRTANPLFTQYCVQNNLVDYITYSESGNFAVRESCELLMGLNQTYNEVITHRKNFSETYQNYLTQRQAATTNIFTLQNGIITKVS